VSAPASNSAYSWQWPDTGPTPVNYGLDTEIFDSEKFPHVQTFVREAIQNSLDAREDRSQPVTVTFAFHADPLGSRKRFLNDLPQKKAACGLTWPADWDAGQMTWLIVEDSNSSGLKGDLTKRTSDFWNYWLNFGLSNKNGTGRGGRGIGRITFLIASRISTVIGVTRRACDGAVAACGMSVLKPIMVGEDFKSSYAYLARSASKSVYDLYDDQSFLTDLIEAFETADYIIADSTGLSLIIPYPHASLTRDGIIAAAIEHFAPAILGNALIVEADNETVDAEGIEAQALRVAELFPDGPLREDPRRYLHLLRQSTTKPDFVLKVKNPAAKIAEELDEETRAQLREKFDAGESLALTLQVPVTRAGKTTFSCLQAAIARAPKARKPHDLFFREGMCLPEVSARNAADVDLVVQSNEGELVTYLNFCEGKAHLGLIENKEVAAKLAENGFDGGYTVKRFVRRLMDDLRSLVLPDTTKPDASIYSGFFSIPKDGSSSQAGTGAKAKTAPIPPKPPIPLPPPQLRIFLVDDLPDGFRIRANPKYQSWPVNLRAEIAYADGSRRPKWSRHDFELQKLKLEQMGSGDRAINNNVLICRDCGADFEIEVRGFDTRRELITNVRPFRNA
jgi:hypothetical protein